MYYTIMLGRHVGSPLMQHVDRQNIASAKPSLIEDRTRLSIRERLRHFLIGMGSVYQLFPSDFDYEPQHGCIDDDWKKLDDDWRKVHADLEKVIQRVKRENIVPH